MKLSHILFALLIGMLGVMALAYAIPEMPRTAEGAALGHGYTHPEFKTMQAGGDGAERGRRIFWVGFGFAILQVFFFAGLIAFGARKRGTVGPLRRPLTIGVTVYALVFVALFLAYRHYLAAGSIPLIFSFPLPTAIMLYGIWTIPIVFMVIYFLYFDRWIMTPEDLEKFRRLVDERRRRGEGEK